MTATGTERLRLSARVAIETADDGGVVVYHPDRAFRLRLAEPLYRVLLQFTEAASLAEVVPDDADPQLRRSLETLLQKGFLVRDDGEYEDDVPGTSRRLKPVAPTFLNCPRRGASRTDVSVVGVPFDLGTSTWAGSRWAPGELRKRSVDNQYRVDIATRRPLGWFDVQHKRRILEGVTFSDWGDVAFQYGEPVEEIYRRIGAVTAEIVEGGSFPLVLGGDHSVAYPVVEALQRREKVVVLYLDAHTDFKPIARGASHNHSSTARRIVSLPNVDHILQVGHRGYTLFDKLEMWEGLRLLTLWDVREGGVAAVVDALPTDVAVYISIDVDVLDPLHAPATNNLTPGGFTPDELKALLIAVGESRRVVGMDFCGINPERDVHFLTSRTACHLLFAGLGAAMEPR
jgi:agmatinase